MTVSSASAPIRSSAISKIRGSGFPTPTSQEMTIAPK